MSLVPMLWIAGIARAHPDRLADRADGVLAGPDGCFETDGEVRWTHRSGGFVTTGVGRATWRFEDRIWRLDRFDLAEADRGSLGIRIAPLLLGTAAAVDLHYPTTPGRPFDWPAPVATVPVRSFGQIDTVSVDVAQDGHHTVVRTFSWEGWKQVTGEQAITFGPGGEAVRVRHDTSERPPTGCRVHTVGTAALSHGGLPTTESWTFDARCPLRGWSARWDFTFDQWRGCTRTGPGPAEEG